MAVGGQKVDSSATNGPCSLFDAELNIIFFMKLGGEGVPLIAKPLAFTITALTHKILLFQIQLL